MASGRSKAKLHRSFVRGTALPYVLAASALFCGMALAFLLSEPTRLVPGVSSLAVAVILWAATNLLSGAVFKRPAEARDIADLIALEPLQVRIKVSEMHERWRAHRPTELLTLALVDIWCREGQRQVEEEQAPSLSSLNAALRQDRGFLNATQETD